MTTLEAKIKDQLGSMVFTILSQQQQIEQLQEQIAKMEAEKEPQKEG